MIAGIRFTELVFRFKPNQNAKLIPDNNARVIGIRLDKIADDILVKP